MKRFVNGWCSSRVVLPLLIDFGSGSGVLLLGGEGFGLAYGLQDQRYLLLGSGAWEWQMCLQRVWCCLVSRQCSCSNGLK